MKNFTIILFIFYILFLMGSLFIIDPLLFFLTIFVGFVIGFICLNYYLSFWRGISIGILFIFLPFIFEYLGFRFNLPFFDTHLIQTLTLNQIDLPITLNTLFSIFTIPLLLISALFFSHKLKLFANVKNYHKTFIIITGSLLVALNFLSITNEAIKYQDFLKWLAIALVINFILSWLYKFQVETPEIYKELPIILYLSIYGSRALRSFDYFNLTITVILTFAYLIVLYNEYKLKKISQQEQS
ncbi:MAG: hypothetical protein GF365_01570 [Candidatus Buchananbacteria bacterium]|nr:hypothetical protein [Candidatus Buchananbacteria bacterium]